MCLSCFQIHKSFQTVIFAVMDQLICLYASPQRTLFCPFADTAAPAPRDPLCLS